MMGRNLIETPIDSTVKLRIKEDNAPMDKGCYQRLARILIYISNTRPYISFSMSVVSQFMNHSIEHMEAVYRILRYLKMTLGKEMYFRKNPNKKN